jgi:hypothetical protein
MQENTLPHFVRENSRSTASDIDASRLRDIFEAAVNYTRDLLQNPNFGTSIESARNILESVLVSRVAPPTVTLPLYNDKMNDLLLVLDVRKRKIKAVSPRFPDKRAVLNAALKGLNYG